MSCPAVELVETVRKSNESRLSEIYKELSDMGAMPLVEELLAIQSGEFSSYFARADAKH